MMGVSSRVSPSGRLQILHYSDIINLKTSQSHKFLFPYLDKTNNSLHKAYKIILFYASLRALDLATNNCSHFQLSADRFERSSGQFRDDMWWVRRVAPLLWIFQIRITATISSYLNSSRLGWDRSVLPEIELSTVVCETELSFSTTLADRWIILHNLTSVMLATW